MLGLKYLAKAGYDVAEVRRLPGYGTLKWSRPFYTQALKALEEAHRACFNHPNRDILGMSSGPFSGVNEVLGLFSKIEEDRAVLLTRIELLTTEVIELRKKLHECNQDDGPGNLVHNEHAQAEH